MALLQTTDDSAHSATQSMNRGGDLETEVVPGLGRPREIQERLSQGLCLLSLDGGGVRGLSTLMILETLMMAIIQEQRGAAVKPCEVFDLIGRTSTGG